MPALGRHRRRVHCLPIGLRAQADRETSNADVGDDDDVRLTQNCGPGDAAAGRSRLRSSESAVGPFVLVLCSDSAT